MYVQIALHFHLTYMSSLCVNACFSIYKWISLNNIFNHRVWPSYIWLRAISRLPSSDFIDLYESLMWIQFPIYIVLNFNYIMFHWALFHFFICVSINNYISWKVFECHYLDLSALLIFHFGFVLCKKLKLKLLLLLT